MPNDLDSSIGDLVAALIAEAPVYEPESALRARAAEVPTPLPPPVVVRQGRARVRVGVGFAAVVLVAVLIWVLADRPSNGQRTLSPLGAYPTEAVGVTSDGHLVVFSTPDGHVVRTLARDAIYSEPLGGVSVSADGKWVFYTRLSSDACPSPNLLLLQGPEIAKVAIGGGKPQRVVSFAVSPAASPDGRYLAYTGAPGCSDASQSIVLHGLRSGVTDKRIDARSVPAGTPGTISDLAWAPDSRRLLYRRDIGSTYPYILDVTTATAIEDGHVVKIGDGSAVTGFLGRTGLLVGSFIPGSQSSIDELEIWSFDPVTGQHVKRLFVAGSMQATGDASGRNVLVSGGALYRWSSGDTAPKLIGRGVTNAQWVQRVRG